jgi:hypothetical protein
MKTTIIPAQPGLSAAVVSFGNHLDIPDRRPSEIREVTLPVIAWRFKVNTETGRLEEIEPVVPTQFWGHVFTALWLDNERLLWNDTIYADYAAFMKVICAARDRYDEGDDDDAQPF